MKNTKSQIRDADLVQKYQAPGPITTVMIRNIPTEYTQDELIHEVDESMGWPDLFDFFYLPWDSQNNGNIGYCFVNFKSEDSADSAIQNFTNYRFKKHENKRVAKVSPAHVQGLENNLKHYRDRAVVHGNHPSTPVVVWNGTKVEVCKVFEALRAQGHKSDARRLAIQSAPVPHSTNFFQQATTGVSKAMDTRVRDAQDALRLRSPVRDAPPFSAPSIAVGDDSLVQDMRDQSTTNRMPAAPSPAAHNSVQALLSQLSRFGHTKENSATGLGSPEPTFPKKFEDAIRDPWPPIPAFHRRPQQLTNEWPPLPVFVVDPSNSSSSSLERMERSQQILGRGKAAPASAPGRLLSESLPGNLSLEIAATGRPEDSLTLDSSLDEPASGPTLPIRRNDFAYIDDKGAVEMVVENAHDDVLGRFFKKFYQQEL